LAERAIGHPGHGRDDEIVLQLVGADAHRTCSLLGVRGRAQL
jgi:hypothetical protein